MDNIYYFNNAATSWPKPQCVVDAVKDYFATPPINSARHCNCIKNNEDIDIVCKRKIAEFFNVNTNIFDIVLTPGCTYSANIVINSFRKDIRLITDNCQHNSIYRTHFEKIGTKPEIINFNKLDNFKFNGFNYYVAITHTNNVTGETLTDYQLHKIIDFFSPYNIPIILDITQSAGTYNIDIKSLKYPNLYVICSGHKGLYSTTGIGFLIYPKNSIKKPLISGGTGGINGINYKETGSLEAGTPNELAMVSLVKGIEYIQKKTLNVIQEHKKNLVQHFLDEYHKNKSYFNIIFELCPINVYNINSGILCFKIKDKQKCEEFIQKLTSEYHIMIRSGVHCAPLYHINVLKCEATMRISFGCFNTIKEVDYLLKSLYSISL